MNPELAKLIELQEIDKQISTSKKNCANIEKEINDLQKKVQMAKAQQNTIETQVEEEQKKHRKRERELEIEEEQIKKHKTQLLSVKTNREYQALQNEIAEEEKGKGTIEEKILRSLENIDKLQEKLTDSKEHVKFCEKKAASEQEHKQKILAKIQEQLSNEKDARKQIVKQIKPNLLAEYNKLLAKRAGVAMVQVKDCVCQGCFINIPPQDYEELKRGGKIYFCSSCSRILYVDTGE